MLSTAWRRHWPLLFLVAVIALRSVSGQLPCDCDANADNRAVLLGLYHATNGASWVDPWNTTASVCDWLGVQCVGTSVTSLELRGRGLSGTLPSSLANLTAMVLLDVSINHIGGTLPPEYASWTGLSKFNVRNNSLVGSLPVVYSAWTLVTTFDVGLNVITGVLPTADSAWTAVTWVGVKHNNITGSLPDNYSAWLALSVFDAWNNSIAGSLPVVYSAWTELKTFDVGFNAITGTLPTAYSAWTKLRWISVEDNNITGTLPSAYSAWTFVYRFYAGSNNITGSLPSLYSAWTALEALFVENNNITGTLPKSYSAWTHMESFFIHNNRISGTLPSSYSTWQVITRCDVSNNDIGGTLPADYATWELVTSFMALGNRFSGTLPPSWGAGMRSLQVLTLDSNAVEGTLPDAYRAWGSIHTLSLSHNRLHGALPVSWASLRPVLLNLQGNVGLAGTIPWQWAAMYPLGFGFLFVCNTSLCGTAASVGLPGGFACLEQNVALTSIEAVIGVTTFFPSLECQPSSLPPPPSPPPSRTVPMPPETVPARTTTTIVAVSSSTFIWGATLAATSSTKTAAPLGAMVALQGALGSARLARRCADGHAATADRPRTQRDAPPLSSEVVDNPTSMHIDAFGSVDLAYALGTVLGNAVVVAGVAVLLHGLSGVRKRLRAALHAQPPSTAASFTRRVLLPMLAECLGEDRLPGAVATPYSFLLQPSATAAVLLMALDDRRSTGSTAAGAVALVVWLSPVALLIVKLWRLTPFPLAAQPASDGPSDTADGGLHATWRERWWLLVRPQVVWVRRRGAARRLAEETMDGLGAVFLPYRGGMHAFVVVEVAAALTGGLVIGAADAVDDDDACSAAVWGGVCLAVLACALGATHALLRPLNVWLNTVATCVTCMLAVAVEASVAAAALEVSEVLVTIAALLSLLMLLVGVVGGIDVIVGTKWVALQSPPSQLARPATPTSDKRSKESHNRRRPSHHSDMVHSVHTTGAPNATEPRGALGRAEALRALIELACQRDKNRTNKAES